jgi:hypothetical protein
MKTANTNKDIFAKFITASFVEIQAADIADISNFVVMPSRLQFGNININYKNHFHKENFKKSALLGPLQHRNRPVGPRDRAGNKNGGPLSTRPNN